MTPGTDTWLLGDAATRLRDLQAESVHACVTSPPYYGLRDYGCDGQIGLERTPDEYVSALVDVFREVRRVLRDDGTLWLNLGDSYVGTSGGGQRTPQTNTGISMDALNDRRPVGMRPGKDNPCKPKDLIGIPWMVAFALRADGWYLRSDIIWSKPNPMPESVKDRPTKAHEYVFLLSKSSSYYYDADAIREPSSGCSGGGWSSAYAAEQPAHGGASVGRPEDTGFRNRRSVWTITTQPFAEAHFATMPPALAEPCILAGAPVDGVVLDPFGGAGTTALVARRHGRRFVHIELNPAYLAMAQRRVDGVRYQPSLLTGAA